MIRFATAWAVVCVALGANALAQAPFTPLGIATGVLKEGPARTAGPGEAAGEASPRVRPSNNVRPTARTTAQASATGPGIVYTCDPNIAAAVCNYLNTTIAGLYSAAFTNVNATIYVHYGSTGLGMSQFVVFGVSYRNYRTALQQSLNGPDDATAFAASVPPDSPLPGPATVGLPAPLLRALGFVGPNAALGGIQANLTSCTNNGSAGCYDGVITISQAVQNAGQLYYRTGAIGVNQADFYSVVEHETDEIIGTPSCAFGCTSGFFPSDLYRYQSSGGRSFAPGNNNSCFSPNKGNACFSLDGVTMLQQYHNINNGEDAGDWATNCAVPLVQNAASCGGFGDIDISPAAEIRVLDVIGYTRAATSFTPVQAFTSSTATTNGNCAAPPPLTQFSTTAPFVSVFGSVTGAQKGDLAFIVFVQPDGFYYPTALVAGIGNTGANGAACFSARLPIAGQAAAALLGDWTALVYWNDGETAMFTVHFSITGQACVYTFGSAALAVEPAGGPGIFNIAALPGCPWTLSGFPTWIKPLAASSGSGNGGVPFNALPNTGAYRTATITLAGTGFGIEQGPLAPAGLTAIGSLAEVTSEGGWNFTLRAANLATKAAGARFSFAADGGVPLQLPLMFPQSSVPTATELASTMDRTLPANSHIVLQSSGAAGSGALTGWGQLLATGKIGGFGMFSFPSLKWNAAVPLETRNATSYTLAFDNTSSGANPLATGVAIANLAPSWQDIPVVLRDDTGVLIGTATVSLPSQGHSSFMLNQQYPATAGRRGTVEFDTPAYTNLSGTHAGQISVLGVRTNGSALTTLPVFASGDAAGGAIAHVTYNGGFTSIFHLVNTGSTTATFTLSFNDSNGGALSVPLLLPQSGAEMTTAALTQTLAPGSMLVVQTQANDGAPNVSGSARLKSAGSINGFEIFQATASGQEAAVPLETRTPNSFVLLYDDTGSQTTGVALSNLRASAAAVSVKIYSDLGNLLRTDSITLPANGHVSFTLPAMYVQAVNQRGMVEFVVPQSGQISAIGVLATSSGTLTTIPMLVR